MAFGVRVAPELEHQLDKLARGMGKSRSAYVREAIAQYVQCFSNNDEARRQSALIAEHTSKPNWSDQLPDWTDWTA
jgi:predicted transcriptional regulator